MSQIIEFRSDGFPYMNVNSSNIKIYSSNPKKYQDLYLYYKNIYWNKIALETYLDKVSNYNFFVSRISQGNQQMTKRLVGNKAPLIYELRKTIYRKIF
jgi:hypothetical protein